MLYLAISLTLIALIGGVVLLSKVKNEAMGRFAKWMAYLVIVVSLGMLACELGQAGARMMCCPGHEMGEHGGMGGHGMGAMQYCPPEMCGGEACYVPAGSCCRMGEGKMHGGMKCCDEEMEEGGKGAAGCQDMEEHEGHMEKDSAGKK